MFFRRETSFSGGKYERKISEKIPDVSLGSTIFQIFSLKSWQMEKQKKNRKSENLKP